MDFIKYIKQKKIRNVKKSKVLESQLDLRNIKIRKN